ncbi:MAG TPA: RluA family pseudouridine synthase [Candidatus Binatia bacterium]|nr:RluA family pseudouridine synthase [Candidatus Binatia bacterium]
MERSLVVAGESQRLDQFLQAALPGRSRRLLRRLIADGVVRVNGALGRKGTRLRAGDRVTLPDLPAAIAPEPDLALTILHTDAEIVAVDKPGGMPSHALDPRERGTAAAFLVARFPEMAVVGDPLAPGLVHRLDTGTSGVLLAARTSRTHAAVRAALARREIEKRYIACVVGDARAADGAHVEVALAHDPRDRRRMTAATPGLRAWPAETRVEVLAARADRSVVRVVIRTGVTHQVRAHLAFLGHPVLGDGIYGGPDVGLPPRRHALHAAALAFTRPEDGRRITIEAPLPPDLATLIDER